MPTEDEFLKRENVDGHRPNERSYLVKDNVKLSKITKLLGFGCFFALAIVILSRSTYFNPFGTQRKLEGGRVDQLQFAQCPTTREPPSAKPPASINPWASLTPVEISTIEAYLHSPSFYPPFNLTPSSSANLTISDNCIFLIEAFYPPKSSVIPYLESPSNNTAPPRYARVVIHHGSDPEPFVKDYVLGPLPLDGRTKIRRLTEIYH